MNEEKKPFTVSDRRHFTPEGEAKQASPGEEEPQPTREATPAAEPPHASGPEIPGPSDPVDFAAFLLSLGAQASLLLGLGAEPGKEPGAPDLAGARSLISILEMLHDKTEGRRTPEEDQVLQGILYELRMAYVARTRAGQA